MKENILFSGRKRQENIKQLISSIQSTNKYSEKLEEKKEIVPQKIYNNDIAKIFNKKPSFSENIVKESASNQFVPRNMFIAPICDVWKLQNRFCIDDNNIFFCKNKFNLKNAAINYFNINDYYLSKQNQKTMREVKDYFILVRRYLEIYCPLKCSMNDRGRISVQFIQVDIIDPSRANLLEFIIPSSKSFKLTVMISTLYSKLSKDWAFVEIPFEKDSEKIIFYIYPQEEKTESIEIEIFQDACRIDGRTFELEIRGK